MLAGPDNRTWPWADDVGPRCAYSSYAYDGGRCAEGPASVSGDVRGQNPEGVSHLAGNVSEWVSDVYGEYADGEVTDPLGAIEGRYRVIKEAVTLRLVPV